MLDEQPLSPTIVLGARPGPGCAGAAMACVDKLNLALRWLVGLMLFVMVVIVFLQILARFALPKLGIIISVPWTEELAAT